MVMYKEGYIRRVVMGEGPWRKKCGGGQSSFRLPNTAAGTLCCSSRTSVGEKSGQGGGGPPLLLTLAPGLATDHWAPGPSRPRPHPRPAGSPQGWPAEPALPIPPWMHHS